jgi:hypothetical protein
MGTLAVLGENVKAEAVHGHIGRVVENCVKAEFVHWHFGHAVENETGFANWRIGTLAMGRASKTMTCISAHWPLCLCGK